MDQETILPDEKPQVFLTPREHHYLWLMAQGYTPRQTQPILDTVSTPALSTRVREKLGARTTEQAVYNACQLDLLGPYRECGSMQGYRAHRGRHEDACRACSRAFAEYVDRNDTVVIKRIALTEPETRLLRAFHAGRTFNQVIKNWGVSRRTMDDVRTSLYRKLDVSHLPPKVRHKAALEEGRRRGILLPTADQLPPSSRKPRGYRTTTLTELETRTLAAVAGGRSLSQAGRLLDGIPGSSVSSRLAVIYRKLGVLGYGHGERREAALKEARNRGYAV